MMSLVERLERNAVRAPDAEALVHNEERVCYGQLWRHVRATCVFLRRQSLPRQARVALLLHNSIPYVTAYYGALAAGGVVVPLNTGAKAIDITNWLAHCQAGWLFLDVTHPEAAAVQQWCEGRVKIIAVNGTAAGTFAWSQVPASNADNVTGFDVGDPDQLATILYTSGTTGRPKGVMLSHGNLAANIDSILAYLGLGTHDRVVSGLPFYYSYGNSVLHTHLAAGACVVMEDNLLYPHRVLARMQQERVTGLSGVASTYALLLSRIAFDQYDLRALRYLTQAGGHMPTTHVERLQQALPWVRLFVMYGQTEASARLSYVPPERLHEKLGSAGIAIPGVTLDIRDESGAALAPHQIGEIWARGANVMLGYWDDPAATRQTLVNGWLKTGDMAYRDAEGYLYIHGRRTDMLKSGAHRIHPHEIEAAIAELEGVHDVAVVGAPDEILGQVVKAYIVPSPGAQLDAMRVKAHCRDRLATYKLPKFIDFVAELPRTATGKVKKFMLETGIS